MSEHIEITADALIALRTEHPLAARLALPPTHDRLFLTKGGREMAARAQAVDPVYAQFNLARYLWFAERLADAAGRLPQFVVAGAGFDTRTMTLPAFQAGQSAVFELDFPAKLAEKAAVLARAGVALPAYLHPVAVDLARDDLAAALDAAGYRRDRPTALVAEGVSFFLPGAAAARLVDPATLGLAAGSRLLVDLWARSRAQSLNAALGRPLFGDPPFGDDAAEIAASLGRVGWRDVRVRPLREVCRDLGIDEIADPLGDSWFVCEAQLE